MGIRLKKRSVLVLHALAPPSCRRRRPPHSRPPEEKEEKEKQRVWCDCGAQYSGESKGSSTAPLVRGACRSVELDIFPGSSRHPLRSRARSGRARERERERERRTQKAKKKQKRRRARLARRPEAKHRAQKPKQEKEARGGASARANTCVVSSMNIGLDDSDRDNLKKRISSFAASRFFLSLCLGLGSGASGGKSAKKREKGQGKDDR